jgi:hypothetical protein
MFKTLAILILNLTLVSSHLRELKIRTCSACPQCTQCDTKRGTCSIPLSGSCQINNINGVCVSGACNTQITVPPVPLKKCQSYQCPPSGTCSIVSVIDGSDCTFPGNVVHSFCLSNGCTAVIEALPKTLPAYNFGCLGFPDGVSCDTNLNVLDGETCQGGICKFPNGNYNGILPPQ